MRQGDNCPSIAREVYGDARRIDLLHRDNPQLGRPPHHLRPGQILQLSPRGAAQTQSTTGPDARLTFVRRDVQTFTPEQHPGHPDDPLNRGNRVNTLSDASAEVTFADETQLQLGEQTLVVIFGDTRSAVRRGVASDTTLVNGSLRARLGAMAGRTTIPISTGAARAEIGSGEAQVTVDAARTTRVAVYHGESRISAMRRVVRVREGYGSRVRLGQPPSDPQLLPAAPRWVSPPSALVQTYDSTATITGEYAAGPGTGPAPAQWHVQIARDERFNDLVVDTRVPASVTRVEARGVEPASLFIRVSAIDGDPFEGPPSEVSRVRVARITSSPTRNGRVVLDVGSGIYCAVDDAPLALVERPIEIDGDRSHRLRCALDSTGTGAVTTDIARPPTDADSRAARARDSSASPGPSSQSQVTRDVPTRERALRFHLGAFTGIAVATNALGSGPAVGMEAGVDYPLGPGVAFAGIGASYERHAIDGSGRLPCDSNPPSMPCLGTVGGTYDYSLVEDDVSLGANIGYRFLPARARVAPYLAFTPAYVGQRVASVSFGQRNVEHGNGYSVGVTLGAELRLGPGGLFVELAGRYAPIQLRQSGDGILSVFRAVLGYRLRF